MLLAPTEACQPGRPIRLVVTEQHRVGFRKLRRSYWGLLLCSASACMGWADSCGGGAQYSGVKFHKKRGEPRLPVSAPASGGSGVNLHCWSCDIGRRARSLQPPVPRPLCDAPGQSSSGVSGCRWNHRQSCRVRHRAVSARGSRPAQSLRFRPSGQLRQ